MSDYPQLHHEQLDSYRTAVAFLALAAQLNEALPRGQHHLGDQLKRASLSIPLNIAEGYGKPSGPDRKRFYAIARASAHECGAILDATEVLKLVDEALYVEGKTLLYRIVCMLVKMQG